jgi:hypothetical protein
MGNAAVLGDTMPLILMNILAYLAIITLLGLVAVLGWSVQLGLGMWRRTTSTSRLVEAPIKKANRIARTGADLAMKLRDRALSSVAHCQDGADSVARAGRNIAGVAQSIEISGIASESIRAVESIRSGSEAAILFDQVVQTIRQAAAANQDDE